MKTNSIFSSQTNVKYCQTPAHKKHKHFNSMNKITIQYSKTKLIICKTIQSHSNKRPLTHIPISTSPPSPHFAINENLIRKAWQPAMTNNGDFYHLSAAAHLCPQKTYFSVVLNVPRVLISVCVELSSTENGIPRSRHFAVK